MPTHGGNSRAVSVGDFDGDANADIVFTNDFSSGGRVYVRLGNGDATFQAGVSYDAGNDPLAITAGDFNGDGRDDLVVNDDSNALVRVLLANANGSFAPPVTMAAFAIVDKLAVGDFNSDGKLDLTFTHASNGATSVLLGNGDGNFSPGVTYAMGGAVLPLTVGDFDGDSHADIACGTTFTVAVLINDGNWPVPIPGFDPNPALLITSEFKFQKTRRRSYMKVHVKRFKLELLENRPAVHLPRHPLSDGGVGKDFRGDLRYCINKVNAH